MFRLLTALFFLLSLYASASSQDLSSQSQSPTNKAFFDDNISYAAQRYEAQIDKEWTTAERDKETWLKMGTVALNGADPVSAIRAFAAATILDKNNPDAWLGLARAYAQMKSENSGERYRFLNKGTSAAFNAYKKAGNGSLEADALTTLAGLLQRRQYWRPALNAYKASLDLRETPDIRQIYEKLRKERGFRFTNYTVDSDAKDPRVCAQFSEPLPPKGTDFESFVRVDGKDPKALSAERKQLCISGLTHGERYSISILPGLPSTVGENSAKKIDITVYVRDRKPTVRFSGRAYVLPKTGQKGIPLTSVNTETVNLTIYRIGDRSLLNSVLTGNFGRQINSYSANQIANQKGQQVWKGTMPTKMDLNNEVTTAVPVDKALPKLQAGLYVMVAEPKGGKQNWDAKATQWFVVSDLGISAFTGRDGIHGFVRSLSDAAPQEKIELRLIARNNEILASANTDASGYVKFDTALTRGTGGNEPAMLVATRPGSDYAFLDLTKSSFDLTDRGVEGRPAPGTLDPFIYAERGVYRPGETVHITSLLRDQTGRAVKNLPLTLIYSRPDGVEYQRTTLKDKGQGSSSHDLNLQSTAMTGTWSARLYADPKAAPIGQTTFLVEDFVPERLAMRLNAEPQPLATGETAKINLEGNYLYGAPGSDLALEGDITIASTGGYVRGYDGYIFGKQNEITPPVTRPLFNLPRTDKDGKALITTLIPRLPETSQNMRATVNLRLQESGGRAISRSVNLKLKPAKPLIGIKPSFKDDESGEEQNATFDIIALGKNLQPTTLSGLKWELLRLNRHFQWYNQNGSWRYEPVTYTNRIANGTLNTEGSTPARIDQILKNGRYRLEVSSDDPNGPAATYEFTAGWYAPDPADTPDILDIALDKESYKPGDTAKVTLSPRADGKAVIAVLSERLITKKEVDVKAGENIVEIPVTQEWSPGAYVTATFYRPLDEKAGRMPGRAIGIQWLALDKENDNLTINLDVQEKLRPNKSLTIPVKLDGLKSGSKANIVIAAVDLGILNLTDYKSPAPTTYYYGQRRLGTEIRDIYGHLIDGMQAVRGRIRSGGDGGISMNAAPPSQKPVALYSGIVKTDSNGNAKVTFDIPSFDGTLRLMAIAWNDDQLGETQKDVIVRDPIVLTGTTPRFMTAGDKSNLHLVIDNVEGPAGDYDLELGLEGPLFTTPESLSTNFALDAKERTDFMLPFEAKSVGKAKLSVTLNGPDGYKASRAYDIPVHPAVPDVKRRFVSDLTAEGGKLTISKDAYDGLIPSTVQVAVNVAPGAALDVPGLLLSLDRYPYGCAEQITSRALPLLYLSSLADKTGVAGDKGVKERVQKAINRLTELQDSSGGFGLWNPYNADLWLTAYITDFLTRAKEASYRVKPETFTQSLDRLANFINYAPDFSTGGEDIAYALYVLGRNSRANIGDLRYFVDTKLGNFSSPLARAQLGAALSLYGDKERSRTAFRSSLNLLNANTAINPNMSVYRSDYGSSLRDGAATLTLISETDTERNAIPSLTKTLEQIRATSAYTTTQESAWLLLAANTLLDEKKKLSLSVNGTSTDKPIRKVLTVEDFALGDYVVTNNGKSQLSAAVTIHGSSLSPEPAAKKGFELSRSYFTLSGEPVDITTVKQNARLVTVLKVTEQTPQRGRLIVEDRLPAGFEIENPRLVSGSDTKSLSWLSNSISTDMASFRDDKFVAAFNLGSSSKKAKPATATMAYIVRAVAPGTYIHPAAKVEDMYRPDRFAQTEGGTVTIKPTGQ